ncbi:MAG: type II secretion system inner membrane protein GspF [Pseudomonadota bacterium]
MPSFDYEAVDAQGRARKGVITADTARLARQELRRLSLTPVALDAASATKRLKTEAGKADKAARIKARQLPALTRQLSVLIGASIPLEEAIGAIALQSDQPGVRQRFLSVRERVTEGWRFADALGEDRKSFPDLYRAVVAAGETSGDLGPVLERLATMLEKNSAMKNKALGAMIYPIALALVAGAVVSALMTLVVPKIIAQFEAFDAELPLVTRIVIGVSEFLGSYGLYMIGAVVLGGIAFWQAMRTPSMKLKIDEAMLKLPLLGRLLRGLDGARFARTLATLVSGGAPLLDALRGAKQTVGNSFIKNKLDAVIVQVREGASMAASLKRANVLPSMMLHMVAAGERAGSVPAMLDNAASQLEDEFETTSNVALRLLEPAIIVIMGGVVMMIVVAILLPMLQLNSIAGQ